MLTLHTPECEDEPLPKQRCARCHQCKLTRGGGGEADWWRLSPTAAPGATLRTRLTKTVGCRNRKIHRPEGLMGLGVGCFLDPQLFLVPAHVHPFHCQVSGPWEPRGRRSSQPHPRSSKALWVCDHGYWLTWVTKVTGVLGYNHSTHLWSWGSLPWSPVSTGHVGTEHGQGPLAARGRTCLSVVGGSLSQG